MGCDAGMDHAVVSRRRLHCNITLFVDEQNIELVACQLSCDRAADDAAADDENIGLSSLERTVGEFRRTYCGLGESFE